MLTLYEAGSIFKPRAEAARSEIHEALTLQCQSKHVYLSDH